MNNIVVLMQFVFYVINLTLSIMNTKYTIFMPAYCVHPNPIYLTFL